MSRAQNRIPPPLKRHTEMTQAARRPTTGGSATNSALYTQFCIGVELGDDALVRDLMVRGADPTVSYGVDGVITTPMRSALSKGDVPMALALLSSRATRVRLADLDGAARVKRELVTPLLVRRISDALEDGAQNTLYQRSSAQMPTRGRRNITSKLSLADAVAQHVKETRAHSIAATTDDIEETTTEEEDNDTTDTEVDTVPPPIISTLPHASASDRPRCPPQELLDNSAAAPDVEESEEEDDIQDLEEDEEEDEESEVSSDTSTVGDEDDE